MPAKISLEQLLEKSTYRDPNSGCWVWTGSVCVDGYGKARNSHLPKETLAHRMSWHIRYGEIPAGTEIDHLCKVRCCVNPDHLQAVPHSENVRRGDYKTNHRNRIKTHCKRGHVLDGENLLVETYDGIRMRKCRECRRMAQLKRRLMKALLGIEVREIH